MPVVRKASAVELSFPPICIHTRLAHRSAKFIFPGLSYPRRPHHLSPFASPLSSPFSTNIFLASLDITSPSFASKTQPARHRMIYSLLKDELAQEGGIHALQLRTKTPDEVAKEEARKNQA
jgi:BolA-like protein 1